MTCADWGTEADLDGDGLCEDCAAEGWGDASPERRVETVQVAEGVL